MRTAALLLCGIVCACGGSGGMNGDDVDAPHGPVDAAPDAPVGNPPPTADEIVAALGACTTISNNSYETDVGEAATVPVCGTGTVVWWSADMDIDCDGAITTHCNIDADPDFQADTFVHDSTDKPLDAAALPYIVVPSPSSRWDYTGVDLQPGAVFAVIYNHQLTYAVFGDTGPTQIIGEASYATAVALGIDPDPSTGGSDGPVIYVGFTGAGAVVDPVEDPAKATELGIAQARALVGP